MTGRGNTDPPKTDTHVIRAIITGTLFSIGQLEKLAQMSPSRRDSQYMVPLPSPQPSPHGLTSPGGYDLEGEEGNFWK